MEKEKEDDDRRDGVELPEDVLLFLFSFLDFPSLQSASLASHQFNRISKDHTLNTFSHPEYRVLAGNFTPPGYETMYCYFSITKSVVGCCLKRSVYRGSYYGCEESYRGVIRISLPNCEKTELDAANLVLCTKDHYLFYKSPPTFSLATKENPRQVWRSMSSHLSISCDWRNMNADGSTSWVCIDDNWSGSSVGRKLYLFDVEKNSNTWALCVPCRMKKILLFCGKYCVGLLERSSPPVLVVCEIGENEVKDIFEWESSVTIASIWDNELLFCDNTKVGEELQILDLEKKERVFDLDVSTILNIEEHERGISAIGHNGNIVVVSQTPTRDHPFPILRIYSRRNKKCLFTVATSHYVSANYSWRIPSQAWNRIVVRNDFDILMGSERKVSRLTFNQNRRAVKVLVVPQTVEEGGKYKGLKWFREEWVLPSKILKFAMRETETLENTITSRILKEKEKKFRIHILLKVSTPTGTYKEHAIFNLLFPNANAYLHSRDHTQHTFEGFVVGEKNIAKIETFMHEKANSLIIPYASAALLFPVGNIVMVQETYDPKLGWKISNFDEKEILEKLNNPVITT